MRSNTLTYLSLVLTAFFWGSAFNVGGHIVRYMPPISAGIERFVLATALLLAILGFGRRLRLQALRGNLLALVAVGLLGVAGFNLAMFFGLQSTSPLNAALIMATTPLWTLLISAVLEGERIHRWRIAGLGSGLAGVVLVVTQGDPIALLKMGLARGDLIVLGGALSWALATVLSRRQVKGATAQETTAYSIGFGTIALLVLGLLHEQPLAAVAQAPASVHLGIVYLALCSTVLGYLFWFEATRRIGAPRTSSFFNLVPVSTLLVGIAQGQQPNLWQVTGVLAVIAGVVLASRPQAEAPAAPALRECVGRS